MTAPEAEDEYYRAIEEQFLRRRGAVMLLSPRDWALIGEWRAAGIPLRVVLQAIDNVFDAFARRATKGRRINALAYCRQEVLGLFDLHRSLQGAAAGRPPAGAAGGDPARVVERHIGRLHRRVREAMASASAAGHDTLVAALATAAARLKGLRREAKAGALDPSGLDEALRRLDAALLDAGRAALPADVVNSLEAEAGRAIAGERARMTPGAFAATRLLLVGRRLRELCRLPRLTLFD